MQSLPSVRSRTPPEAKWLINEHAALSGQVNVLKGRLAHLQRQLDRLEAMAEPLRSSIQQTSQELASTLQRRDAFRDVFQTSHPEAALCAVAPVSAWAGRYGERGALKEFVRALVQEQAPKSITAVHVLEKVIFHFGLNPSTSAERRQIRLSVRSALRSLRDMDNVVESLFEEATGSRRGVWRWKAQLSLSDLAALVHGGAHDSQAERFFGEVDAE